MSKVVIWSGLIGDYERALRAPVLGESGNTTTHNEHLNPNGEVCYNISKETTSRELVSIDGVDEEVFRMQNMGLSAGHTNALEYCSTMMGFPTLDKLLDYANQKNNNTQ